MNANRNLVRISIREIMLLQLVVALFVWADVAVIGLPILCMFLPFPLTVWAAFRLRNFPHLTIVNPFTIAVVFNWILFAVLFLIELCRSMLSQAHQGAVGVEDLGMIVGMFVLVAPGLGCVEGFMALLIVKGITNLFDKPPTP